MSKMYSGIWDQVKMIKDIIDTLPCTNHLRVHSCYNLVVPPQWKIEDRINDDFHIVYIKGGKGFYRIGEDKVSFEKGKIIFVSSGMLHSSGQGSNPPNIIPVRFGIYHNSDLAQIKPCPIPFSIALIPQNSQDFLMLFEKLHKVFLKKSNSYYDALSSSILNEILLKLCIELNEKEAEIDFDPRMERVKQYIDENSETKLTTDQLAKMTGLSKKYFRNLFKRCHGVGPKEYLVGARIAYGRFLLEQTEQNVKQVAASLGYPDQYSFSKQFKQVFGYPPSALKGFN